MYNGPVVNGGGLLHIYETDLLNDYGGEIPYDCYKMIYRKYLIDPINTQSQTRIQLISELDALMGSTNWDRVLLEFY